MNKIARPPKIFVANLPWITGSEELKAYFSKFGNLDYAEVVFDIKTGVSKGFGFIRFNRISEHEKALSETEHKIDGGKVLIREGLD